MFLRHLIEVNKWVVVLKFKGANWRLDSSSSNGELKGSM